MRKKIKKKKRIESFRKINLPDRMGSIDIYGNNAKEPFNFLILELSFFTGVEVSALAMNAMGWPTQLSLAACFDAGSDQKGEEDPPQAPPYMRWCASKTSNCKGAFKNAL